MPINIECENLRNILLCDIWRIANRLLTFAEGKWQRVDKWLDRM